VLNRRWTRQALCAFFVISSFVRALEAQELPDRFSESTLVEEPPAGYEFPLAFSDSFVDASDPASLRLMMTFRARQLSKKFMVREIVFENVRINDHPVVLEPFEASFATQRNSAVELDPLPVPLGTREIQRLLDSGEAVFQADAYVLVSPTLLEMIRFRARTVALYFPIDTRLDLNRPESEPSTDDRARYFAPIVYQHTNDPRKDFITRFDFDGNWNSDDNSDHFDDFPLPAYVYYSAIESRSHYFFGYFFYHPLDYTKLTGPACGFFNRVGAHENDLEGVQLVVEKDGTRFGKLVAMETLAHDIFYQLENDTRIRDKREADGPVEDIDGHIEIESDETGQHPMVYIECLGHGVWGYRHNGKEMGPDDTYVIYRPGEKAEEPSHKNDHDVSYELIDVFHQTDGLWVQRDRFGDVDVKTYSAPQPFWDGFRYDRNLGSAFYSSGGVNARPPWGWQAKGTRRGDWFFAPAFSFKRHLDIPGLEGENLEYVRNPYLKPGGTNPTSDLEGKDLEYVLSGTSTPRDSNPIVPAEPSQGSERTGPTPSIAPLPDDSALADATRLLLNNRELVERIESLDSLGDLFTDGETLLLPLARQLVELKGGEASRFTFRYMSVLGLSAIRLYWKSEGMDQFDEEHSVRLSLSSKPGWHWQTIELMELSSFDHLATINEFRVSVEFDRDLVSWNFSGTELAEMLRELPQSLEVLFSPSEYLSAVPDVR